MIHCLFISTADGKTLLMADSCFAQTHMHKCLTNLLQAHDSAGDVGESAGRAAAATEDYAQRAKTSVARGTASGTNGRQNRHVTALSLLVRQQARLHRQLRSTQQQPRPS